MTLAHQVVARSVAVVLTTLLVVGVATGALLHAAAIHGLDGALLAAAHARIAAGAERSERAPLETENVRAPVEAFIAGPRDLGALPQRALREMRQTERPVTVDDGADRVLLLSAEREDGSEHEETIVAGARAPRVTLRDSIGLFSAVYGIVAALVALAASALLLRLMRRAVAPLSRAREEAARVVGLGQGARLGVDGPEEVAGLMRSMNGLLDRLDDAFHAQTRFTAEAAHELRTPVTVMLGEIEVTLRRTRTAGEYREAFLTVKESVERVRNLVNGLTTLARIDAGHSEQAREQTNALEIAEAALKAEHATLEEAGCRAKLVRADDGPVRANRALIEAALANLLRNAAAYAPGSEVTLTVTRVGGATRFTVDDGGPGVPHEERERVFDRFARAGEARRSNPAGLGLGLPLAREVARRHGGDCTLDDAPGGGARAVLTIFQSSSDESQRSDA